MCMLMYCVQSQHVHVLALKTNSGHILLISGSVTLLD